LLEKDKHSVWIKAGIVLIDKIGTLTTGKPRLTDTVRLNRISAERLLTLAASAERFSEHPLAEAVRQAARERELPLLNTQAFSATPGRGVQATVDGAWVEVGSWRILEGQSLPAAARLPDCPAYHAGGQDEPGLHHRLQHRRPDPGSCWHSAAHSGRRCSIAARPGYSGKLLTTAATEITEQKNLF